MKKYDFWMKNVGQHCTPLCNKGLAAVDYAREWIAEHGAEGR